MSTEILLIILGFIFLTKGADLLVKSATSIAKRSGVSEMLIGLTIVAIGTSLPEIFITITSATDGLSDLIIGNAIGSCICNFLLVIGITSLIKPVKLSKRIVQKHLPIGMVAMVLLLFLGNTDTFGHVQIIGRFEGLILILCTVAYIMYTIYEEKKLKDTKMDKEVIDSVKAQGTHSVPVTVIYMILGILGLKFGSDFVVDNAILIAERFGLSEKFIGMTIVAVGTALPEITTGIVAAMKGKTDLLLGNIAGSNILNLCLLIGLGAIISPLAYATAFNASILILLAVTIFIRLIAALNKKRELDGERGLFLIILYVFYIGSLL